MSNLQIYKYISEKKFPIRDKYIYFRGNFNKNIKTRVSFLNGHFNVLLKKDEREQQISNSIKRYNLIMKNIEEEKQKRIKLEINKKIRLILNKRKIKSVSNNKMILDIMLKNSQFINYLNEKKTLKKKKKIFSHSNDSISFRDNLNNIKRRNYSSPFMTEIKTISYTPSIEYKNKKNNSKNSKDSKLLKDIFEIRLKKTPINKNIYKNCKSISIKSKNSNLNDYFKKGVNFLLTPKIKQNRKNFFISNTKFSPEKIILKTSKFLNYNNNTTKIKK